MTKDLNKGISDIQYNALNLPNQIDIKNPVAEARNEYHYSADGVKRKVIKKWNPNYSTNPVMGSNITASSLTFTETTDYVGNLVFVNNTLQRALTENGYIEGNVYHYNIKDHLGSTRVVVNSSDTKVQWLHYYPFGMMFGDVGSLALQPYKYTGQEFDHTHGMNLYDYKARLYDPAIARFTTMDPLAEKYYSVSPYAYCLNNPVRFVDPDGRFVSTFIGTIVGGVSGAYSAYKSGTDIWAGASEGAVAGAITGAFIDGAIALTVASGGGALAFIGAGIAAGTLGGAAGAVAGDVTGQVVSQRSEETILISNDNFANKAIDGAISGAVSGVAGGAVKALGKAAEASTKAVQQTMSQKITSTATNLTNQGASQGTVNAATNSITRGMGTAVTNTANSMMKVEAAAATATETTSKAVEEQLKKKN